jgi:hypothetical protein
VDATALAAFFGVEDGVEQQMLERLTQLDAAEDKKHRDPKNRIRDVLIGHTAIRINATLISDDPQLRQLFSEFGGRAISTSDLRVSMWRTLVGLWRTLGWIGREFPSRNKTGRMV